MSASGQFSCPPAGSLVAVSGQFLVAADSSSTRSTLKFRDGQVGNRPIYGAIGVDMAGHKDILGIWAGTAVAGSQRSSGSRC